MRISNSFRVSSFARHALLAAALALTSIGAARAATQAEALVSDNIHKGLEILNSRQLSPDQRSGQFETFLLGVTDMKRISAFTLGSYAAKISPADRDAFAVSFQAYAVAVYQSYLGKYAGQALKVTGSRQNAPGDDIVTTTMSDTDGRSLPIDFRVRSDTGKPVIVDFSVAGIWLALEERDQFSAFLGQNGGSISSLIAHLDTLRAKIATAG